jgi:hypothetical protein
MRTARSALGDDRGNAVCDDDKPPFPFRGKSAEAVLDMPRRAAGETRRAKPDEMAIDLARQ